MSGRLTSEFRASGSHSVIMTRSCRQCHGTLECPVRCFVYVSGFIILSGGEGIRTPGPLLAKQVLSH
jgi:hypothetical protein